MAKIAELKEKANWVRNQTLEMCVSVGIGHLASSFSCVEILVALYYGGILRFDPAKKYLHLLRKTGIGVRLFFIIGLPGEPDDIVERTLAFIDEIGPSSVLMSILCPLPGSILFKQPRRFGITINTFDWRQYTLTTGRFGEDELPNIVFEYDEVTPWGKGTSKEKIFQNYVQLQSTLRERGLIF